MVRALIAPIIIAPLVCGSLPAFAQGHPSADQIINSLRPSGNLVQGGTRGIRLAAPSDDSNASGAPAATTQAPSAVVPQPRVSANRPEPASQSQPPPVGPSVNLTVNFESGSADLTPDAIRTLDQLGEALASKELSSYKFRIEGHTDTVGTKELNRELSARRAEAVVDYVSKKFGVDTSRLQAVGMGEEGLLVQTPNQKPEPRNRRVQVINLGA